MKSIVITDSKNSSLNTIYLYSSLGDIISGTRSRITESVTGERVYITIFTEDRYYNLVKSEVQDRIADIITINYKNKYIKPYIKPYGLSEIERQLLISAIISADLEDDKRYVMNRICDMEIFSVDGIMNFRLKPLKEKWDEVINYIPESFSKSQLKEFMIYLLEEKKNNKVYVSCEKVYDGRYNRLIRSFLLGQNNLRIINEVILSCSNKVELKGNIPEEDEYYLKEYYGGRIIFS